MPELAEKALILGLLVAVPGVVMGLLLCGVLRMGRIAIATASTSAGLTLALLRRISEHGPAGQSLVLTALLAMNLLPTIMFWRHLLPTRKVREAAKPAPGPIPQPAGIPAPIQNTEEIEI